jgi:hypothetical protein
MAVLSSAQPSAQESCTPVITTPDQAVELALEYTGFDRAEYKRGKDPAEMTSKVVVTEDKTPFFHDRIVNKELWVVTFDSVYVEIPRLAPSYERNQTRKTYDIYFEPETGHLLKIESRWDGHDSTLSEEPPADIAAEDMSKNGIAYLDFVKVIPEVDFYHALQIAPECYAANAKQIIAHLVISDQGGGDPRPVWSILGRGTPPFHHFGGPTSAVPVWQRNRMRCLVDATNGDYLLWMVNIPAVDPPPGWPLDSGEKGE